MFWKKSKESSGSAALISPDYLALLTEKHNTDPEWGKSGIKFVDRVDAVITDFSPDTALDYGCGKGALAAELHKRRPALPIVLYDPGIPQHRAVPLPADLVICTDVLEHIEPELLDNVLIDIARLTKRVAYLVIFTGDCGHKLPDGRPAHLIQKPQGWWEGRLLEAFENYFDFAFAQIDAHRFEVLITRRSEPMTEQEALERAEHVARILSGQEDPAPDLSQIDEPAPRRRAGGMLGSFSYTESK